MPKANGEKFSISDDPKFHDPETARAFLEAQRWPNGPECPHCGVIGEAYRLTADTENKKAKGHGRNGLLKCAACDKQFTVTVGTIMEDSHIPLNKWLYAFHLLCASKKGISAHQMHRMIGVTYKTAWFMMHRVRYAMTQEPLSSKLQGFVEIDECYIGGREKGMRGKPGVDSKKAPVVTMVERTLVGKGRIRSVAMERVTADNLRTVLRGNIEKQATLNTDEASIYQGIARWFGAHKTVNHKENVYSRREENGETITTNTVEGFFGNLKRGINGVYHHVDRHHLHRYLTEFDFRYNARDVDDVERRDLAIKQVGGKRLKYRDSCGKRTEEVPF
jgi:transposase-like protein